MSRPTSPLDRHRAAENRRRAGGAEPVVCFAKPGAGYSRGYYTDRPARSGDRQCGAQAELARRTRLDLRVGRLSAWATAPSMGRDALGFAPVVAASEAAEADVLAGRGRHPDRRARQGRDPVKIGIGQSMGGCLTVVQQGHFHGYDGVGVLGYGVFGTLPPTAPGTPPTRVAVDAAGCGDGGGGDDECAGAGRAESAASPGHRRRWRGGSTTTTSIGRWWRWTWRTIRPARGSAGVGVGDDPEPVDLWCFAPGAVMVEAAAITAPVLVAMGERDVVVDPRGEVRAHASSSERRPVRVPEDGAHAQLCGDREELSARIETWA